MKKELALSAMLAMAAVQIGGAYPTEAQVTEAVNKPIKKEYYETYEINGKEVTGVDMLSVVSDIRRELMVFAKTPKERDDVRKVFAAANGFTRRGGKTREEIFDYILENCPTEEKMALRAQLGIVEERKPLSEEQKKKNAALWEKQKAEWAAKNADAVAAKRAEWIAAAEAARKAAAVQQEANQENNPMQETQPEGEQKEAGTPAAPNPAPQPPAANPTANSSPP